MKYFFMFVIFIVAGYFAYQEIKPKPAPPPPPPPAILSRPSIVRPLLSPEDENKIARSAQDTNKTVRWQALKLLANSNSSLALPLLFEHLKHDPSLELRVKILALLSKYPHNKDVLTNIISALQDYEPQIRLAALKSLDNMKAYASAPDITLLLKDPEESVRQEALLTLNDLQKKRQEEIDAACRKWQEEVQAMKTAEQSGRTETLPPEPQECAVPAVR